MTATKTLQKIDVFISSPSDVQAERDAIYAIVTAINEEPSVRERYVLKPLAYERLVPPEVGDKPQKVVDKYMREAGKADLFIGVLWSRMGTPVTDDDGTDYQSGTEYEFRKAYEARTSPRGKPIMLLYRSLRAIPPTADFEQAGRVQAFFKRFEGDAADFKGLYKTYDTLDEFKALIRQHLLEVLAQIDPDADDVQPLPPIRRRADHYQHIPLPTNYVERTDLLTELRRALIGDASEVALTSAIKSSTPQNPTALHGMGGIGKSVMARALCDDPQVHAAFPDGILWATCGQTPNLIQQLRGWIKAFNETPDDKAELEDLKAHAAKLLASRACLLIIDDVWDKAHAQAFRVGGANCRTIITTRDEMIAEELGAKIERIPPMSEPDAINLLELWAKDNLATVSHADKAKIVNRVGRLALAIKLAGGQLIRQSVDDWLKGFDVHKLKSRRPDSINPHDSLEVCFGLSLSQLAAEDRRLYAALSIFREDEPILERAVSKLWDAFGDSDPSATSDLIDDLGARALLEITQAQYPRAFILHDLLRDLMNDELGSNRNTAHEALIAAYAQTQTDDGWPSAPDDGYLYTHLAYHLHSVGRNEELYALLTDSPAWMEAKFIACMGDRAYVDDLELAISDFHDPLTADQVLTLTKLWTARQVVNARVSLYKDIDLQTLVWMGRTHEALIHTNLRPESKGKADGLLAINQALQDRDSPDARLLSQAFEYACTIADTHARAETLLAIVTTLVQTGRVDEALNVIVAIDDAEYRAAALVQVRRFEEALAIARSVDRGVLSFSSFTSDIRNIIVSGLTKAGHFDEALSLTHTIEHPGLRNASLRDIAIALGETGRFDEALTTAHSIQEVMTRIKTLSKLAAELVRVGQPADAIFDELLSLVATIKNSFARAEVMRDISVALARAGRFDEALSLARAIETTSVQVNTLRNVAIELAQAGRFDEALSTARAIEATSSRVEALREIAVVLAQSGQSVQTIFDEALNIIRSGNVKMTSFGNSFSPVDTLRGIAFALARMGQPAQAIFDEALSVARTTEDTRSHAEALGAIVTTLLQTRHFDEALSLAQDIKGSSARTDALNNVAAALARLGRIDEAHNLIRAIVDVRFRATALARLGDLEEALSLAHAIKEAAIRANTLSNIATVLAQIERFDEAFSLAHAITHNDYRLAALSSIAIALAQTERFEEALSTAHAIEDAAIRADTLSNIAVALAKLGQPAQTIFDEALQTARTIDSDRLRSTALSKVVAALAQSERFEEAFSTVHSIDYEKFAGSPSGSPRMNALRDVAIALAQSGRFDDALRTALTIDNVAIRADALRGSAVALAQLGHFDEALNITRVIDSNAQRISALRDIAANIAKAGKFEYASKQLGLRELSAYLQALSIWRDGFEKLKPNLTLDILREAVRIAAWHDTQWNDVHALFVKMMAT